MKTLSNCAGLLAFLCAGAVQAGIISPDTATSSFVTNGYVNLSAYGGPNLLPSDSWWNDGNTTINDQNTRILFDTDDRPTFTFGFSAPQAVEAFILYNGWNAPNNEVINFSLQFLDSSNAILQTLSHSFTGTVTTQVFNFTPVAGVSSVKFFNITTNGSGGIVEAREVKFVVPEPGALALLGLGLAALGFARRRKA